LKVAIVSSLYEPNAHGGAERVAQSVAEALVGQGHRVDVISLGKAARAERTELNGVQVHTLPLRNLYWPFPVAPAGPVRKVAWHAIDAHNLRMARAVDTLLGEVRPELVNTHLIAGFSAAIWRAVARRGLPLVHTLHDHYLLCPYSTMFKNGKNCARQCLGCRVATLPRRAMTRHVDGVIGVSRYILDRHLDVGLFPGVGASVVYSGYRRPGRRPPQAAARAAGEPLRIGYLGGLFANKGVHRLLKAFLSLAPQAAQLWIAGAGDPAYEASLKARSAARGDVRWLGVVRPEDFLPHLDLLVVPSLVNEAMGRVVVEAFAFGVPVAAAKRGGIPELLARGGGWLFDPDQRGALRALLARLLADRAALAAMRPVALAQAPRFSGESMYSGYLAAYEQARIRRSRMLAGQRTP
jgi:glycosyltransferase involved in cell wall biosynthesis